MLQYSENRKPWLDESALSNEEFNVYTTITKEILVNNTISSDDLADTLINHYKFPFSTVSAAFNALFAAQSAFPAQQVFAVFRLLSHTDTSDKDVARWQEYLFDQTPPHRNLIKELSTSQFGHIKQPKKHHTKHLPPVPPPRTKPFADNNPFNTMIQSSKPTLPPRRSNSYRHDKVQEQQQQHRQDMFNQNDVISYSDTKNSSVPPRPPPKPRVVSLEERKRPSFVQRSRSLQISASEIRSLFGVDRGERGDEDSASLLRHSNYTALP
ncbi:hypothetical protein E3P99_00328 [Wallemia hederae]|uniref:Uncharacterized protein n=1 Tax=Wallemia hederae TaxID=1540922 RepID=A0A4T0FZA1_9BASI|nr:hypothetical protein E3P99_00328 [Wallemia hederae]